MKSDPRFLSARLSFLAVLALMEFVFPWAAQYSPLTRDVTLGSG